MDSDKCISQNGHFNKFMRLIGNTMQGFWARQPKFASEENKSEGRRGTLFPMCMNAEQNETKRQMHQICWRSFISMNIVNWHFAFGQYTAEVTSHSLRSICDWITTVRKYSLWEVRSILILSFAQDWYECARIYQRQPQIVTELANLLLYAVRRFCMIAENLPTLCPFSHGRIFSVSSKMKVFFNVKMPLCRWG